jgi:hypothetical protein
MESQEGNIPTCIFLVSFNEGRFDEKPAATVVD